MKIIATILFCILLSVDCVPQIGIGNQSDVEKEMGEFDVNVIRDILRENKEMKEKMEELSELVHRSINMEKTGHQEEEFCRKSYCDTLNDRMTEQLSYMRRENADIDIGIATFNGSTRNSQDAPRFIAQSASGGVTYLPTGTIILEEELYDNSNCYDVNTGKFTAPQSGTYYFQFHSGTDAATTMVYAYVNDYSHYYFYDREDSSSDHRQYTFFFTVQLDYGDELYLKNSYSGSLVYASNIPITFMGHLIPY